MFLGVLAIVESYSFIVEDGLGGKQLKKPRIAKIAHGC